MPRRIFIRRKRNRTRLRTCLIGGICVVAALAVSACIPNRTAYSQPTASAYQVRTLERVHAVQFRPGSTMVSSIERTRLQTFFAELGPQPVTGWTVRLGGALGGARWTSLQQTLAEIGAPAMQPVFHGAAGDSAVVAGHQTVDAPVACDPGPVRGFSDQAPISPFGCTNALNLARMVADPADLYRGQPLEPANGRQAVGAVEAYVADEVELISVGTPTGD